MSLPGLVRAKNLSDVEDKENAWDNLCNGISYTIGGSTSTGVVIKGKDILALEDISEVDVKELVYLSGLSSAAQPRLTTIAANVATATQLQSQSLLKASPQSTGNYQINGTLTASSLQINGFGVGSISTSPFSGSSSTALIRVSGVVADTSFKLDATVTSGSLSSPERAIPIETDGMYLYVRAGQS